MKKIVRLTESDLVRLVKRVINEQQAQDNKHTLIVDRNGFLTNVDSAFPLVNMSGNRDADCKIPFTFNRSRGTFDSRTIGIERNKDGTFTYTGSIQAKPGLMRTVSADGTTAGVSSQGMPCGHEEAWTTGSPLYLYNKINTQNKIKKGDTIRIVFKGN